jgi:uncharacterized protein (UPF0335 family)
MACDWCRQAADRIEALTKERDEAIRAERQTYRDAVEVFARIEALTAENAKLHDHIEGVAKNTHKIMVGYEAKLAKAVEALNAAVGYYDKVNPFRQADYHNESCDCDRCRFDRARATWGEPSDYDPIGLKATLAEIKGESRE